MDVQNPEESSTSSSYDSRLRDGKKGQSREREKDVRELCMGERLNVEGK